MTNKANNQGIIPSTKVIQLTLILKITTAQVVETSVTVNNNSLFRTTFTWTIKLNLLLNRLLGSNPSQFHHIMLLAIRTTQVRKAVKKNNKKGYEKFASRGFKPGYSE